MIRLQSLPWFFLLSARLYPRKCVRVTRTWMVWNWLMNRAVPEARLTYWPVRTTIGTLWLGRRNEAKKVIRSTQWNSWHKLHHTLNLIIDRHNSLIFQPSQDDVLANTLKSFWETESVGISELTTDGDVQNESFEINVKRNEDRYEVKLPWKEDCLPSSNCYHLCESRLRSLHQRLRREPSLLSEYDNIIEEQLKTGIVEEVPAEDLKNDNNTSRSHYLPHLAVVRKDRETTKVRVVYDGWFSEGFQERKIIGRLPTNWPKPTTVRL